MGVAAVIFAILFAYQARQDSPASAAFEEIQPNIYRLNYEFRAPIILTMPTAAWLIKLSQNSWILVAAGAEQPQHIQALVRVLREKLGPSQDSLKLILTKLARTVSHCNTKCHNSAGTANSKP